MDFQAIVEAQLDTSKALSQYNELISKMKSGVDIPVKVNAKSVGNVGKDIQKQFKTSLNSVKISTFDKQITAWARSNSKSITAVMSDGSKTYGRAMSDYHDKLKSLMKEIDDNDGVLTSNHVKQFNEIRDGFRNLQADAKATGNIGKTFGEQFSSAFGSMAKFATSYLSIRQIFSTMREGISTVTALDDALVDLQKTSTATPKQLNAFYKEANDIAKEYGTTTQQVIQSSADWSRLG